MEDLLREFLGTGTRGTSENAMRLKSAVLSLLSTTTTALSPPMAWTIAGSDSSGGAGVEADVAAMRCLGVHGCPVITALTAQNTVKVAQVMPSTQVRETLDTLVEDLGYPGAVKIGMLANGDIANQIADFLESRPSECFVVVDPVLASTSGRRLLDEEAEEILRRRILPAADLITPNAVEAQALLNSDVDLAEAAMTLGQTYNTIILAKGGHSRDVATDVYYDPSLSSSLYYLRCPVKEKKIEVHGTGCVLSAALAASVARGESPFDAAVVAKAVCTEAIEGALPIGHGPPPAAVPIGRWPLGSPTLPIILRRLDQRYCSFPRILRRCPEHDDDASVPMRLYAIADSDKRATDLFEAGVRDVQLRIKNKSMEEVRSQITSAVLVAKRYAARLWVNDYWELALECGAFGVHLGQEDLRDDLLAEGNNKKLNKLAGSGLRLGISTHTPSELAIALALRPSYIAVGPIFGTASKKMVFGPRGLDYVQDWRTLVPRDTTLVAIGGIDIKSAPEVLNRGADSIAVISALPREPGPDLLRAVDKWDRRLSWPPNPRRERSWWCHPDRHPGEPFFGG